MYIFKRTIRRAKKCSWKLKMKGERNKKKSIGGLKDKVNLLETKAKRQKKKKWGGGWG